MKNSYELGQKEFDGLLGLFSANREEAGEKYEEVRRGLVRFFHFRGCSDPQSLTDETINRVAAKLDAFDRSRNIRPVSYFYGFASNILLEYRRRAAKELEYTDGQIMDRGTIPAEDPNDAFRACLDECLEDLPDKEKNLVIEYYSRDKQERIELRQKVCERLQCTAAALYTRVSRIKSTLKDCIEACTSRNV
ncbi:MAG: hypothetical protein ABIU09_10140 [Pyrinomonadaceae bacterium]